VKKLNLQQPDEEIVQGWYDKSMNVFREDSWVGKPESSMELHLLSGTRDIEAQSFRRLEPRLDNLRVFGCIKNLSAERMRELNQNEKYGSRRVEINRSYAEEGNWEMSSYLQSIYGAVPDQDVSLEFFSVDADLENLNYNIAVGEEIEETMREDKDFSVTGVELNAFSEGNFPENTYGKLKSSLFCNIHFLYGGDENLTQEYNAITDQWGDPNNYSGVPGVVKVGEERPIGYFFDSPELSADGSEVDDWLYDNLGSNLGAKSIVRKKN